MKDMRFSAQSLGNNDIFADNEKEWDSFIRWSADEGLLGIGWSNVSLLRLYQAFRFKKAIRSHATLLRYSDPVPAVVRDVPDGEIPGNPPLLDEEHWEFLACCDLLGMGRIDEARDRFKTLAESRYSSWGYLGLSRCTLEQAKQTAHREGQPLDTGLKDESHALCRKAASLGNGAAMLELGTVWYGGESILGEDRQKAKYWIEKAEVSDEPLTWIHLAMLYLGTESPVKQNIGKAVRILKKCAEINYSASYMLGKIYASGHAYGMHTDLAAARKHYAAAACGGNPDAAYELAQLLEGQERPRPEDIAYASYWLNAAAECGSENAKREIDEVWFDFGEVGQYSPRQMLSRAYEDGWRPLREEYPSERPVFCRVLEGAELPAPGGKSCGCQDHGGQFWFKNAVCCVCGKKLANYMAADRPGMLHYDELLRTQFGAGDDTLFSPETSEERTGTEKAGDLLLCAWHPEKGQVRRLDALCPACAGRLCEDAPDERISDICSMHRDLGASALGFAAGLYGSMPGDLFELACPGYSFLDAFPGDVRSLRDSISGLQPEAREYRLSVFLRTHCADIEEKIMRAMEQRCVSFDRDEQDGIKRLNSAVDELGSGQVSFVEYLDTLSGNVGILHSVDPDSLRAHAHAFDTKEWARQKISAALQPVLRGILEDDLEKCGGRKRGQARS